MKILSPAERIKDTEKIIKKLKEAGTSHHTIESLEIYLELIKQLHSEGKLLPIRLGQSPLHNIIELGNNDQPG